MNVAKDLTKLIGNTPLLCLDRFCAKKAFHAQILAKLESFNPFSSAKDRIALALIEDAEKTGKLKPGGVIIEPTSGNTGIGLAFVAAIRGYPIILTMPDTMSLERRKLLKALGAKIILTPGSQGMQGAIDMANKLVEQTCDAYIPGQFTNPANPEIHKRTTAQEIWRDTDGKIDIFVAGVGTGGTLTGIGQGLKEKRSDIQIVAVEPSGSPVLSGGKPGPHKLQGIGAGFIPQILDRNVIDEVIPVSDEDAFATCRELAKKEGVLVGISSGAALFAAALLASKDENKQKTIVTLFPDTGERYLSTNLFIDNEE